jgi:hypothetical protein
MLCESIAYTLQDVTAKPFLNPGNHVATLWLITCGILTRGASDFLHGNNRLANTLRESSDSIAKQRAKALLDVRANTYPDIGKHVAQARQIMCVVTPFLFPVIHSLSSLHSKSNNQMHDLIHDRNHVLLGSGYFIFSGRVISRPWQTHCKKLADILQKPPSYDRITNGTTW